jgi:hypothetical protein
MAAKVDNAQRLRYIRVLERFSQSIVNYLFQSEELSKETYDKKVANNSRYLNRVEAVPLYKGEYSELEKLVKKMIALSQGDEAIDTIKETLLYEANQIEKSMNRRRYKKEKHRSNQFKDWE